MLLFLAPRGNVCENAENARKYNEFANVVRSACILNFHAVFYLAVRHFGSS